MPDGITIDTNDNDQWQVADEGIGTEQIANEAVTGSKVALGAIDGTKMTMNSQPADSAYLWNGADGFDEVVVARKSALDDVASDVSDLSGVVSGLSGEVSDLETAVAAIPTDAISGTIGVGEIPKGSGTGGHEVSASNLTDDGSVITANGNNTGGHAMRIANQSSTNLSLFIDGGLKHHERRVSANQTLNGSDCLVVCNVGGTGAGITLTLPTLSAVISGMHLTFLDAANNAGTRNISIARAGTDTMFNGTTTLVLATSGFVVEFWAVQTGTSTYTWVYKIL